MKLFSILIQYRLFLYLLSPLVAIITVVMAIRNGDRAYIPERFGFYRRSISSNRLWFHAASVGEVNAVAPLIHAMAKRHPEQEFLLTSGTPTGALIAQKQNIKNTEILYLPLDFPGSVARFVKHAKPKCAIIMETELWANLYYACDKNKIPITIVNARLSERTLKANAWMYKLYAETLSHVSRILARSEQDANGFMTIGATASKIRTIGNIKLAPVDVSHVEPTAELSRPYTIVASTHDNEEEVLARAWLKHFPDRMLVIAPRHPIRRKDISAKISKLTKHFALRSQDPIPVIDTVIYIADTLGELNSLMKGADIVIMGGSFVPVGGHNIIEPARFGKPIITGPYMDNFKDEVNMFLASGACIQVADENELIGVVQDLLHNREKKERLIQNAGKTITQYSDVIDRYITAIETPYSKYQPEDLILQSNRD